MQQTNTILLYNLPLLLPRHHKGASLFLVNYRTTMKPANNKIIFHYNHRDKRNGGMKQWQISDRA